MVELAHYKAVNLARKFTSQNENDMLGFSGYEDDGDEKVYTKDMCEELSKHVMAVKHLPNQCMKFSDIVHSVEVNEKDSVHPSSFLS
ncbi:hypothetical protein CTEN210_03812 [Chaetoceros tenuissimus]|uniref:Uncharacterized protein n=1 Tax=Chaetoceros tenuissimus TaxID=426638 RepID=A0AAD3CJP9_9STRA|nr:hypothetical protein CTEN210_03812 [Chaetoceros tenuissimus]